MSQKSYRIKKEKTEQKRTTKMGANFFESLNTAMTGSDRSPFA